VSEAASVLAKLFTQSDSIEVSFSLDRKEVVARLVAMGAVKDLDRAKELLEGGEPQLLDTVYVDDWAIRYNVFTDRYHFDRLLPPDVLVRLAEQHSRRLGRSLEDALWRVSPRQFELFVGVLLNRLQGFRSVRVSKASRDGGVDFSAIEARPDAPDLHVYGQAKHWQSAVSAPEVQKLIGVLAVKAKGGTAVRGMFIAISGFTEPANRVIRDSPYSVEPLGLSDLVSLMIANGVGTQHVAIDCVVSDSSFWEEIYEL
jgi:hypothetical protein